VSSNDDARVKFISGAAVIVAVAFAFYMVFF
jgi:hypothetical protein